jgi:hypothetical protein
VPFDLGRIQVHTYYRGEDSVTETDLVRSLETLVPAFTAQASTAGGETDSPVFEHLPCLTPVVLPQSLDQTQYDKVDELTLEINTEEELRRPQNLLKLSEEISDDPLLTGTTKERLQGKIAQAMVSLDQSDDARTLLARLPGRARSGKMSPFSSTMRTPSSGAGTATATPIWRKPSAF